MKTLLMQNPILRSSLAFAALTLAPLSAQARTDGGAASPDAPFPENTYAVVRFAGLGACREASDASPLLELIRAKTAAIAGFDPVDALVVEALPQLESQLRQLGVSRRDLRDLLRAPMQLGVSRITFFDEDPVPGLALAIDATGGRGELLDRLADRFLGMVAGQNDQLSLTERTIEGRQAKVIRHAEQMGSVVGGRIGDWYVLADNEHYFAEIARTANSGAKTVFGTKGLRWADARQSGSNLASVWLHTGPFYDALGLLLPYDADPILDALGLERLHGVYVGMDALPGSGTELLRIAADHSDDGLLGSLVQPGLDANAARFLPPETLLYAGANLDPQKLLTALDGLFRALPTPVREEIGQGLEEMTEELGAMGLTMAELRDGFAQFGPQLTFGVATTSNPIPDGYLFVGTRRQGFADMVAGLLEQQGAPIKSQDVRGHKMYFVTVPMGEVRLTPSFCEVDGGLLITSSPLALKAALARDAGERPTLREAEDFQARMAANRSAAGMFLLRLGTVGADLYAQYLPLLRGLVESEAPEGVLAEDLPTADEMRAALSDLCTVVSRDRGGITVRTESFLSSGALLGMLGGLVDEVLSVDLERDN